MKTVSLSNRNKSRFPQPVKLPLRSLFWAVGVNIDLLIKTQCCSPFTGKINQLLWNKQVKSLNLFFNIVRLLLSAINVVCYRWRSCLQSGSQGFQRHVHCYDDWVHPPCCWLSSLPIDFPSVKCFCNALDLQQESRSNLIIRLFGFHCNDKAQMCHYGYTTLCMKK